MSDNFYKFLFLGAMMVLAVFANHSPVSKQTAGFSYSGGDAGGAATRGKSSPVFVLRSPQVPVQSLPTAAIADGDRNADLVSPTSTGEKKFSGRTYATPSDYADVSDYAAPPGSASGNFLEAANVPLQPTFYRFGSDPRPEIQTRIALLADLKSGESFWGLETNKRWPLASITKLVSAAVVLQNMDLNQPVTLGVNGSSAENFGKNLEAGGKFKIGDLVLAMLLESNNGAAETLAGFYGRDRFVREMNDLASSWGLADTHFNDPTGLSVSDQSTAADLLKLVRRIYSERPEIFRITRKPKVSIIELNSGKRIVIKNINDFADKADFLGGKTGYTDEAGGNLLSVFSYPSPLHKGEGRPVFIVVLGSDDRFGETEKLLNWFERNFKAH